MTTVVSRLYADAATANGVAANLAKAGFPAATVDIVTAADATAIAATRVHKDDAAAYAAKMQAGNALLVVRAPVTPFGAARRAMEIVEQVEAIPVGGVSRPNYHISEVARTDLYVSVLTDHPLFLTSRKGPYAMQNMGLLSEGMSWPLLSKHRTTRSASSGWFASATFWPGKRLSAHRTKRSVYPGGKRFLYNPEKLA